jgi:hypothetical protein
LNINFWVVFKTAEAVFTRHVQPMARTYLDSQTCPDLGPNMSGSWVSAYIYMRGLGTPLNPNLAKLLSSLSCCSQGSPKAIWDLLHRIPSVSRGFDSSSPQDLQTLSSSLSPKVFSRFSFDFFDLLLIFVNVRSPYLGAPLGCHNLALNLV